MQYARLLSTENTTLNTSAGKATELHIANFGDFFRISGFFIAFFLVYVIAVPILMRFVTGFRLLGFIKQLREKGHGLSNVSKRLEVLTRSIDHNSGNYLAVIYIGDSYPILPDLGFEIGFLRCIQLLVWLRHDFDWLLPLILISGICQLVWQQLALNFNYSYFTVCCLNVRFFILSHCHFPALILHIQWDISYLYGFEFHILDILDLF